MENKPKQKYMEIEFEKNTYNDEEDEYNNESNFEEEKLAN